VERHRAFASHGPPGAEAEEQPANPQRHVLHSAHGGCPWRDLPERYGPYTTVYNRFIRWRKAGIWDRMMDAIVKAHDGKVQMIDSSIVRVHQHASGVKKRVELVAWAEVEAASPRRSTPASMRRAARSAS